MLIQDLKDPKYLFDLKNNTNDLSTEEENSEVNKEITDTRIRQYI